MIEGQKPDYFDMLMGIESAIKVGQALSDLGGWKNPHKAPEYKPEASLPVAQAAQPVGQVAK